MESYTTITATQWTSLPAEFRHSGTSEHSQNQKRGRKLDSFLEGPLFVDSLSLLFVVDIPYGRIFSVDPTTATWSLVLEYDGEPNGLAWNPQSQSIVITDFKQGILSFDPKTKSLSIVVSRFHGERLAKAEHWRACPIVARTAATKRILRRPKASPITEQDSAPSKAPSCKHAFLVVSNRWLLEESDG